MTKRRISLGLWKLGAARWHWFCRLAAVVCLAIGAAPAQQEGPGKNTAGNSRASRAGQFRAITSRSSFNDINRSDARAALRAWFNVMGREKGITVDSEVDIIDSVDEIRERLRSQSVELLTLTAADYLELESSAMLTPVLTDARDGQGAALYSYVLLVGPAFKTGTIAGLRGKNVLISSRTGANAGSAWMEVVLAKEKLGRADSFFASVRAVAKPQACILPLFFGAVDACVVDEVNLNMAKEMNPQLGQLQVLARSRPMIESVISTPLEAHPMQKDFIDAMLSLHQNPRGRQLLLVFKTERLVRLRPGDLDSARELWRDYHRVTGSPSPRPVTSRPARPAVAAPAAESRQANASQVKDED